jgi:dolichyl-phosphate-mannose--protein O-mannosyl transferase
VIKFKNILFNIGYVLLGVLSWIGIFICIYVLGCMCFILFYLLMNIKIIEFIILAIACAFCLLMCWCLGKAIIDKIKYYIARRKINKGDK